MRPGCWLDICVTLGVVLDVEFITGKRGKVCSHLDLGLLGAINVILCIFVSMSYIHK